MASRTGTVIDVEILRGNDTQTTKLYKTCVVYVNNDTSSTVIGGTDTLDANLQTAIQNKLRNGKTVTPRSIAIHQAGAAGGTEYAATVALSSVTAQITPKNVSDWSTNATLPANTTPMTRYYGVYCLFEET
jgi:hypothetical protein